MYYKPPEAFVKKIKDNANAKEVLDEYGEVLIEKKAETEQVEFFDTPQVTTFVQKDNTAPPANTNIDLLDTTPTVQPVKPPVPAPPQPSGG